MPAAPVRAVLRRQPSEAVGRTRWRNRRAAKRATRRSRAPGGRSTPRPERTSSRASARTSVVCVSIPMPARPRPPPRLARARTRSGPMSCSARRAVRPVSRGRAAPARSRTDPRRSAGREPVRRAAQCRLAAAIPIRSRAIRTGKPPRPRSPRESGSRRRSTSPRRPRCRRPAPGISTLSGLLGLIAARPRVPRPASNSIVHAQRRPVRPWRHNHPDGGHRQQGRDDWSETSCRPHRPTSTRFVTAFHLERRSPSTGATPARQACCFKPSLTPSRCASGDSRMRITWCLGWNTSKPAKINLRGRTLINPPRRSTAARTRGQHLQPQDRHGDVPDAEDGFRGPAGSQTQSAGGAGVSGFPNSPRVLKGGLVLVDPQSARSAGSSRCSTTPTR